MGIKVTKFGGSSLANAEQFKKVIEILKADSQRRYAIQSTGMGKRYLRLRASVSAGMIKLPTFYINATTLRQQERA